ncbi:hypothetical protein HPS57_12955 [Prevotella sp. PINT]|jgi:hypothetical protein|uniref:hypothetical protein n=1 Tax=Palleniella intestinalis TaxID=2736291 RepID=UPI0015564969|nr:hypothetical protein [Palleniella intestinalis]NPD82878.1 hypothetical protein [Palleniella intestinalis]
MTATIQNPYAAWLIIGCAALVLLIVFGSTICHRLAIFNHKHHIVEWDDSSVYTWEDDDE